MPGRGPPLTPKREAGARGSEGENFWEKKPFDNFAPGGMESKVFLQSGAHPARLDLFPRIFQILLTWGRGFSQANIRGPTCFQGDKMAID